MIKDEDKNNLSKDELVLLLRQSQKSQEQSQQTIIKLQSTIETLSHQLEKLQRMLFGQSSERVCKPKKESSVNAARVNIEAKSVASSEQANRNGRRRLPDHLSRTVVKHDFPEDKKSCTHCNGKLICIGKDVSEQLEFIPSQLFVIEHRRYKYNCRYCKTVFSAPMPEQPIDKGLPGPALLAHTLIDKFQNHQPLLRQAQKYERLGYAIPSSTLGDWVSTSAHLLAPLVNAMHEDMLVMSPKIHSDDTIIPVLNKHKTHNGRLWVYIGAGHSAPTNIVYRYSKTRSGKEPQKYLADYKGYLQADAYAGYNKCYESGEIVEVACMAHARRKFIDALKSAEKDVVIERAVAYIKELYIIEAKIKSWTIDERYYYRRRFAKPLLQEFYKWLIYHKDTAPPKSPLGKAIQYSLNHWRALNNYLLSGELAIDNNIAERAMRSVVLGRKNYLFAGSHKGAENAAVAYSLIETCKALGINTFEYLTDVLTKLPTTLNPQIKTLLPYNWKPSQKVHMLRM